MATMAKEQSFVPPGPGSWILEATHYTRPATRFQAEVFPEPFSRGFSETFRRYGSLLETVEAAFVHGFNYLCIRPVGAPKDAAGHPPRAVWDHIASSHPEIRERLATSERVFETKLWREDLARWDREVKPAAIRAHLELLAVDPTALGTEDLLTYLERCRENQMHGTYLHHLFNAPAMVPIGDYLVHAQEWTGRSAAETLRPLQGASPDPLGTGDELRRLVDALRRDHGATARLAGPDSPAQIVAALRAAPGELGALARAYIDRVGYRPVNGEDVGEPSVIELPELIVAAIRSALEATDSDQAEREAQGAAEAIRDQVPAAHRARFDELLGEARLVSRLRDERGAYADLWAIGITRRALLAAGRRLVEQGRLADPTHLVEAGYDEVRTLIATSGGPSAEELAERAAYRTQARYADAPPFLGSEPGPPLPAEWLPPATARLERAFGAVVQQILLTPQSKTEARKVQGVGVSPGRYRGTARVVHNSEELGRIQPGDVLVATATTTAFNIVLPLLGAIVTDRGGLLSHAAIVAREYGLPAVVGCTDATAVIPDGAVVSVDGQSGVVEVQG